MIQHLQKHGFLEGNWHLTDLKINLLTAVVLSEGFSDHLGKDLKRQYPENQVFQVDTAATAGGTRGVGGNISLTISKQATPCPLKGHGVAISYYL